MIIDDSIFKAYDIRGVYGHNLHDHIAEALGKAFTKVVPTDTVIVGRDARVSSPALHTALIKGLNSVGVHVVDVGMVSTDMYYYACAEKKLPGIMITASHNPKEYNGFKMVKQIPYLLSGDAGIQDLRVLIENDDYAVPTATPGTVETWDVMPGFIQKILSLVDHQNFKPLKIVADTANGMVGPSYTELFKQLPMLELIPMYFEPDGNFPNHGGDPLIEANRKELMERVVQENADIGIANDPDGDRFFCIDKKGRFISGDFFTAILSIYFLQKYPQSTIIYDIRASKAVRDTVQKNGGKGLYNRVGHAYIKQRMSDENAVFGGEVTGHYYFKDFYLCDSGAAPLMFLVDLLSKNDKTLDKINDEFLQNYHISGEINNKVPDVNAVLASLEEKYGPQAQEIIKIDGLTCEFEDWRFNVRGSNTEPLIRLNLEGNTPEIMQSKRDEILKVITGA